MQLVTPSTAYPPARQCLSYADLFQTSRRTRWPFHSTIPKGPSQVGRQTELPGLAWKFFKRTVDIAEYGNANDDVNSSDRSINVV